MTAKSLTLVMNKTLLAIADGADPNGMFGLAQAFGRREDQAKVKTILELVERSLLKYRANGDLEISPAGIDAAKSLRTKRMRMRGAK